MTNQPATLASSSGARIEAFAAEGRLGSVAGVAVALAGRWPDLQGRDGRAIRDVLTR